MQALLVMRPALDVMRVPHLLLPLMTMVIRDVLLLVPVDLTSSSRELGKGTHGVWLPSNAVLMLWRITYWLIFSLTWFVFFAQLISPVMFARS